MQQDEFTKPSLYKIQITDDLGHSESFYLTPIEIEKMPSSEMGNKLVIVFNKLKNSRENAISKKTK